MAELYYKGNIVLKDKILRGYVGVNNGKIISVCDKAPNGKIIDLGDNYIAPGLIDIHCHSSFNFSAIDNPKEVADFHLSHGVTTMLQTFYRDVPHEKLIKCINKVKEAMSVKDNLYGVHLEGPYINANLGFGVGENQTPDKEIYSQYINSGVIRQWTCAPEIDGVIEFIKDIKDNGIIPAIGHSCASYNQVKSAYDNGAKIVTHIFDATGVTCECEYDGIKDVSFDDACMLMDDMFYEVICDGEWVHVKKQKLDLLIKTVGIDRIVAITDVDCAGLDDDGRDIAVVDGGLFGTKLTLDKVALNLFNAGYKITDIFKMVSLNPATALGLDDRGEIVVGKKADLIVFNKNIKFIEVLK